MTHHGIVFICVKHREVSHWGSCPVCNSYDYTMHPKWRAPRKNNDRAWRMIARGKMYWDTAALRRRAERSRDRTTREERRTRKEIMARQRAHRKKVYHIVEE